MAYGLCQWTKIYVFYRLFRITSWKKRALVYFYLFLLNVKLVLVEVLIIADMVIICFMLADNNEHLEGAPSISSQ